MAPEEPGEVAREIEAPNDMPLGEDEVQESEEMLPSEQAMRNDVVSWEYFKHCLV